MVRHGQRALLVMGKKSADLKMDACLCTGHFFFCRSLCFFVFILAPFVRAIANVVKVGSAFAATGA